MWPYFTCGRTCRARSTATSRPLAGSTARRCGTAPPRRCGSVSCGRRRRRRWRPRRRNARSWPRWPQPNCRTQATTGRCECSRCKMPRRPRARRPANGRKLRAGPRPRPMPWPSCCARSARSPRPRHRPGGRHCVTRSRRRGGVDWRGLSHAIRWVGRVRPGARCRRRRSTARLRTNQNRTARRWLTERWKVRPCAARRRTWKVRPCGADVDGRRARACAFGRVAAIQHEG